MENINFVTGANFAEGKAILSPVITEITNQRDSQVGLESDAEKLGFVVDTLLTPDAEIISMVGPEPLQEIDEDGVAPLVTILNGYSKKVQMKTYGLKSKCTQLFAKWIEAGSQIQGADSSVLAELNTFKESIQRLIDGSTLTLNEVMTQVYAKGFAITAAYGPGSASPDGKALFAADHIIKKTGGTYSNVLSGALTATTLEAGIQYAKTSVKTANGYSIKTPEVFDLMVPRALETAARKILNSNGDQAGVYAGTASNANLLNVFSFQGSKVRLTVLEMYGERAMDGTVIGGTTASSAWFLLNKEYAMKYKAFRVFRLWDNYVTMWKNDETDSMFTKLTVHFTADHFNPETIAGFAGA